MLPGDLPESVSRRAVFGDRTHVVWNLADAPDVIAACEAQGTLLRLAVVVHVGSDAAEPPEDADDWAFGEARLLFPPPWRERVACAAASAREIVEQARPWAETLDAETDAAFFVTQPVSRVEAGRVGFPTVLLVALVGAPLLWSAAVYAAASFTDWRNRFTADEMLWGVATLAAIGLAGALLTLVAAGLERLRLRRTVERTLGAPHRPGERAAPFRALSRVGVLVAVVYIWGPMLAFALAGQLVAPGRAADVTGAVLALLLACWIVAGVAQWRHARST